MPEERGPFLHFVKTVPEHLPPKELFEACLEEQKRIEAIPPQKRVEYILRDLLFLRLFEPAALPGSEPSGLERPFNFSTAEPLDLQVSEADWRYRTLLEELRKQPDRELRWLLVARWLKQEGVCEPDQFLPDETLRNLLRKFREHLRRRRFPASPTDLRHAASVKLWLPYFERLLTELRHAPSHQIVV